MLCLAVHWPQGSSELDPSGGWVYCIIMQCVVRRFVQHCAQSNVRVLPPSLQDGYGGVEDGPGEDRKCGEGSPPGS